MEQVATDETIFLSIDERRAWLKHLRFTKNIDEIERAVYSNDDAILNYIVWNPLLTEAHLRHLNPKITYPLHKVFLIQNPVFPADLLLELAMTLDPNYGGNYIKSHPNATNEIKIIVALRHGGLVLR